jgi:hypothetical protein
MPDERSRRLALNESAFRVANERMDEWPERSGRVEPATYYCECANIDCRERVSLRPEEYQHLRSASRQFGVVPGHEMLDVENVVERHDGYVIVEKMPDALVEGSDPRT